MLKQTRNNFTTADSFNSPLITTQHIRTAYRLTVADADKL